MPLIDDDIRPSYHDPQLWLRLGPRVAQAYEDQCAVIVGRKVPSWEAYNYQMGRLESLREVLAMARELTRIEQGERDEQDRRESVI